MVDRSDELGDQVRGQAGHQDASIGFEAATFGDFEEENQGTDEDDGDDEGIGDDVNDKVEGHVSIILYSKMKK